MTVLRPGTTASAFFYSTPEILSSPVMVPYTLVDREGDRCIRIRPEYSPCGGGRWWPATQGAGGDPTADLAASPNGTDYVFTWDADAFDAGQPPLLFYQVVAACGSTGNLEGPVF